MNHHCRITFTQTSCFPNKPAASFQNLWTLGIALIPRGLPPVHAASSSQLNQVQLWPPLASRGTLASSPALHLRSPAPSVYNCSTRTPSPIPALVARCVVTPSPPSHPPWPPFILPATTTNVTVALRKATPPPDLTYLKSWSRWNRVNARHVSRPTFVCLGLSKRDHYMVAAWIPHFRWWGREVEEGRG